MTVIELRHKYPKAHMYFYKDEEEVSREPHWHDRISDYKVTHYVCLDDDYENGRHVKTVITVNL